MKKILCCSFVLMSLLYCHVASARFYVGGSFSFASNWNEAVQGGLDNMTSIVLSPDLGWSADKNWTAGVKPSVGLSTSSLNDERNICLGISPYVRYRFLEFGKFGLWAEGNADVNYVRSLNASGNGSYSLSYGIGIRPVLTYSLTEHISLYGDIDLFSLSLHGYTAKYPDTGNYHNSFSIGLSGQSDDVINSLSELSIGFIYQF